jgi:hypothetical protein
MSGTRGQVDPGWDDSFDPALFPFPTQRCEECRHPASAHHQEQAGAPELTPEEKAGWILKCDRCPKGRPACSATFELKGVQ